MKIMIRTTLMIAILAIGFAVGFQIGQSDGFSLGSEWALVQAELVARDAGLFMPIRYDNGEFRVLLRQPPHVYRRAWQLADRHAAEMALANQGAEDRGDNRAMIARNSAPIEHAVLDTTGHWIVSMAFQPDLSHVLTP